MPFINYFQLCIQVGPDSLIAPDVVRNSEYTGLEIPVGSVVGHGGCAKNKTNKIHLALGWPNEPSARYITYSLVSPVSLSTSNTGNHPPIS